MGATGQDRVDVGGVAEGDEAESPGATRLGVFHDDAVDDLAEAGEVAEQSVLRCVPTEKGGSLSFTVSFGPLFTICLD